MSGAILQQRIRSEYRPEMPCDYAISLLLGLSGAMLFGALAGCQKLPPGVLAGSSDTLDYSVTEPSDDRSRRQRKATAFVPADTLDSNSFVGRDERPFFDSDAHHLAKRLEVVERELAAMRTERDELRTQLTSTLEQVVESQTQLVEVYRQRAESAEAEVRRVAASAPEGVVR